MNRLLFGVRWIAVTVGIIVLTSFSIDATTQYSIRQSALGIFARSVTDTECGAGMVEVSFDSFMFCADQYEASATAACPYRDPTNVVETESNISTEDCHAQTVSGAPPWRFVSVSQAQRLCAKAGKRLPTSAEWYHLALGAETAACVKNSNTPAQTGSHNCISSMGTYDAVGNLWEWTSAEINGARYNERIVPAEGYVAAVDLSGVAVSTTQAAHDLYGNDYFWSKADGVFGMIRGGYYGSGEDAGVYAVNASVPTSLTSPGVGFRCVEDL